MKSLSKQGIYEKFLENFKAKQSKVSKQGFWKISCKREFYSFEMFSEKAKHFIKHTFTKLV